MGTTSEYSRIRAEADYDASSMLAGRNSHGAELEAGPMCKHPKRAPGAGVDVAGLATVRSPSQEANQFYENDCSFECTN
jgi:hypothetical protein